MDRNLLRGYYTWIDGSLSARRAWIEISGINCKTAETAVALRKESVDRNSIKSANFRACITSLSARRAWIEMVCYKFVGLSCFVALRKESVDRNPSLSLPSRAVRSRSPQGERG